MKLKVRKLVEIDVKYLRVNLPVRYEEEDMPKDFPFRNGDTWEVLIDLETRKIVDWPQGVAFDLYMKVCDEGIYTLLTAEHFPEVEIKQDYVPHGVVPGEYGDYVHLIIAEDGTITNMPKAFDFSQFFRGDE